MAHRKKLFISFSGLLREIKEGRIQETDMWNGIFYFGCTREYAFDPRIGDWNELAVVFGSESHEAITAHRMILQQIMFAETDGRVFWRPDWRLGNSRWSFPDLLLFLESRGYKIPIDVGALEMVDKQRIKEYLEARADIEVVV